MRYRRDDSMDTWRGAVTERLESMDQAIRRLDQSMDAVKRELVDSNRKIAWKHHPMCFHRRAPLRTTKGGDDHTR